MIVLLALHAVVGLALFPTGARLGRRSFLLAIVPPAATLVWLGARLARIVDGDPLVERISWAPRLGLAFELRADGISALMALIIAAIGVAVLVYAAGYFGPDDEGLGRCAGLLTMFAGAMLGVVTADNVLALYTAWELTSITSYLLIGNEHTKPQARAAALHALLVTSAGGLTMLAGFVLIGEAAGTYRLSEILADPPSGGRITTALVLVLIGAFTKSAQYPFHSWLPGAMAAPTPISAYLHSATMVKAGVYLVARLAPAFATVGVWRPLTIGVGLVTMLAGGLRALRQNDLKLLLAFGTVSQLGFLTVLFGAGVEAATAAGCALLVAHAMFKAALFMVVGMVDHGAGTRDLRRLPALDRRWRAVKVVTVVSAASMAGLPLTFGFIAKEAALDALTGGPFSASAWVLAAVVAGSALTFAYSARFALAVLRPGGAASPTTHPPDRAFVAPSVALAAVTLASGVVPWLFDDVVGAAATSLSAVAGATADTGHLAVWHGFTLALGLSAVTYLLGSCIVAARRPLGPVLARGGVVPSGTDVYLGMLRGLNAIADRVTSVVQNGSLPAYAGVVLLTAAVAPGVVLLTSASWPGWPEFADNPAQVAVAVALLSAALAAAIVRRRFSAALFLGVAGYAMAALFVVQGAPDLALTQVAIETLSTVLFVLVLRRLPDRFERTSSTRRRVGRVIISVSVAVTVFCFAIIARGARRSEPVSTEMIERALPEGHGRNVVNVILVDIRGIDTMGEITVLTSAAIGAVALARVGRRRAAARDTSSTAPTSPAAAEVGP